MQAGGGARSGDDTDDDGAVEASAGRSPGFALIVGRSRVNSIVVSKIVERSGLRWVSEIPENASKLLDGECPVLVILDGGSANHDCDDVLPVLISLKAASQAGLPAVVLLSTRNPSPDQSVPDVVDAVVAKPILPEMLQPVVERLMDRTRS